MIETAIGIAPRAARLTTIGALVVFLPSAFGCAQSEVHVVPQNAKVVDVRTPKEYQAGHYPGSVNIPLSELASRTTELGAKNQEIIVYCRSGRRSAVAKKRLIDAGFTKVLNGGTQRHMMSLVPKETQ